MLKGIIAGFVILVVLEMLGAYVFVSQGLVPANADGKPSSLERWAARKSLHATIQHEAPKGANPVALTDDNLLAGAKLYAANCVACHGAADGTASNIAKGLYQHAPQLGKDGVEDDPPGVSYWKVYHGIRLTGMPSFGHTLSQQQIWQVVLFLQHMDSLTPKAEKAWKAMRNPAVATP